MSSAQKKEYFASLSTKTGRSVLAIVNKYSKIHSTKRIRRKRRTFSTDTSSEPNTIVFSFSSIEIDMANKQITIVL